MDPLVFHTREIGSAHHKNRIHETVAHPKRDPIGSTAFHIFSLQEEKTFGLGMKDLASSFAPVRRGGGGRTTHTMRLFHSPFLPSRSDVQTSEIARRAIDVFASTRRGAGRKVETHIDAPTRPLHVHPRTHTYARAHAHAHTTPRATSTQ